MRYEMDKKVRLKLLLLGLAVTYFSYITGEFFLSTSLLTMIYVHECGHLWAARRKGFKTNGIYLLPIGGVSLVEGLEKADRDDEAFIAIMGPIWGIAFSYIFIIAYQITDIYSFLRIGAVLCLINLFNLFPVNPLDGGRISKSVTFSVSKGIGLISMVFMMISAVLVAIYAELPIFYLIAFFCWIDFASERRNVLTKKKMSFTKVLVYALILLPIIILASLPVYLHLTIVMREI